MSYRVVYGETRPAWEQIFPTMREAKAFAKEHKSFGDVIFSVKKVVSGEKPQSWAAAIDAEAREAAEGESEDGKGPA
jgi:hypothetical protein